MALVVPSWATSIARATSELSTSKGSQSWAGTNKRLSRNEVGGMIRIRGRVRDARWDCPFAPTPHDFGSFQPSIRVHLVELARDRARREAPRPWLWLRSFERFLRL